MSDTSEYVTDRYGNFIRHDECEWCYSNAVLEHMALYPSHYNKYGRVMKKHEKEFNKFMKERAHKTCLVIDNDGYDFNILSLCAEHLRMIADTLNA